MLSRSSIRATAALRQHAQCLSTPLRRGMATAADEAKYDFETGEAAGIKYANRNIPGLTGSLAVVAKGGSRYQAAEGFAEVLEKFAFKSTSKRSQLRITRETELLGGELSASHSRENIVLSAKFLNQDLPYYAELFAEVLQDTRYTQHEVDELVLPQVKYTQSTYTSSPRALSLSAAHTAAFHAGLGNAPIPAPTSPWQRNISAESISTFARAVYTKSNIALVGTGNNTANLGKWIGQFFPALAQESTTSSGPFTPRPHVAAKYFGGEARMPSSAGNALTLAFPGSSVPAGSSANPALPVLAELLGGASNIKWSHGTSLLSAIKANVPGSIAITTANIGYSDAGLFAITLTGSAAGIRDTAAPVVEVIRAVAEKGVSDVELARAIANAKYRAIEGATAEAVGHELALAGKVTPLADRLSVLEKVSVESVKEAAKGLLGARASVAAVGDLDVLPYAADVGLDA